MCIAIYIPKNKQVNRLALKRCYEANPDGFGYAYFKNGRLVVKKFVDENVIPSEIEKFHELRKNNLDKQFIVHFRIATHGAVGTKCCHPFVVNRNLVFCHNGVLGDKFTKGLSKSGDMSDTMMFNKLCLQKLPRNFMEVPMYKFLLENAIGFGKMILMNKNGTVWILNEKNGYWDGGIWYSNTSYRKVRFVSYCYKDSDYSYNPKTGMYEVNKRRKKYNKNKITSWYDDDEDYYPYGGYGTSGWSNYGNGYGKEKEELQDDLRGIVIDASGNVVTPGDKKNEK